MGNAVLGVDRRQAPPAPREPLTRVLSGADVARALPHAEARAAMRDALLWHEAHGAGVIPRQQVPVGPGDGTLFSMPIHVPEADEIVVKTLLSRPRNRRAGLPTLRGLVQVIDAPTGALRGLLDGASLTAIRTAAVSALATDLLARTDARVLALVGTGAQAWSHLAALALVRPIDEVRVFSPGRDRREAFVRRALADGWQPRSVVGCRSAADAVDGADVVCTLTSSAAPVVHHHDVTPGVHINAVGSHRADRQEVDAELVRRAAVYVDSREAALQEAGDLLVPAAAGLWSPSAVVGTLGEVLVGRARGRGDKGEMTLFKSCGLAVEDAFAANRALREATLRGIGAEVRL